MTYIDALHGLRDEVTTGEGVGASAVIFASLGGYALGWYIDEQDCGITYPQTLLGAAEAVIMTARSYEGTGEVRIRVGRNMCFSEVTRRLLRQSIERPNGGNVVIFDGGKLEIPMTEAVVIPGIKRGTWVSAIAGSGQYETHTDEVRAVRSIVETARSDSGASDILVHYSCYLRGGARRAVDTTSSELEFRPIPASFDWMPYALPKEAVGPILVSAHSSRMGAGTPTGWAWVTSEGIFDVGTTKNHKDVELRAIKRSVIELRKRKRALLFGIVVHTNSRKAVARAREWLSQEGYANVVVRISGGRTAFTTDEAAQRVATFASRSAQLLDTTIDEERCQQIVDEETLLPSH